MMLSENVKHAENNQTQEFLGLSEPCRRLADYMTCESTITSLPLGSEEDVCVKVKC